MKGDSPKKAQQHDSPKRRRRTMSRGGWIMIIGGIVLLVGIGLFAFVSAGILSSLDTTTLSPGAFQNRAADVQSTESALTYQIQIQDFTAGDELTVFIRTPSGAEVQPATINTASPVNAFFTTTETGVHTVVIENTGGQDVSVLHAVQVIDATTAILGSLIIILGSTGLVVFIIGLILWIVDRGRMRKRPTEVPASPPSAPPLR